MGIIKLSFLTAGALGAAMMHYGRDENLPTDRLGLEPEIKAETIETVSASVSVPVLVPAALTKKISTPKSVAVPTLKADTKILPPAPDSQVAKAIATAKAMAQDAPVAIDASLQSDSPFTTKYVSASAVNLRAGPSTRNGIVGRLTDGMAVLEIGDAGPGWSQIKVVETGQRGFMASRFLSVSR